MEWESGVLKSCAGLPDLASFSLQWAQQLLPVYCNVRDFACPAGISFSTYPIESAERHAALLLHFLDTAVFLRDGTGIQPGEGLPPPRQRQALRRIVDKLSPEAYLQTMLLRIFGAHHGSHRPFLGYYFKNAEQPPPAPVHISSAASGQLGLADDCLPILVGSGISGCSRAAAWYYYGGTGMAGMHAEDAWLHSINAAAQLPALDTSLLGGAIGSEGAWALEASIRLSVCKLWTFAPKHLSAPDLGRVLAAMFGFTQPCGSDKMLVNRHLVINPAWAGAHEQAAAGWEVVRQGAGDVVWADRPHSVCGDCVLAVSWNYALPGRLPAYMRRDLEAAAQLRRSPGGDQVAWGQEQRAFCLGHPLLLAVTQDRGCIAHHPLHSKFLEAAKLLVDRENEHKAALTRTQREAGPPPAHIQEREVDEDHAAQYSCTRCRGSLCCSAYVPIQSCSSSSNLAGVAGIESGGSGGCSGSSSLVKLVGAGSSGGSCPEAGGPMQELGVGGTQQRSAKRQRVGSWAGNGDGSATAMAAAAYVGADATAAAVAATKGSEGGEGPQLERVCAGCVRSHERVWHVRLISEGACSGAGLQSFPDHAGQVHY